MHPEQEKSFPLRSLFPLINFSIPLVLRFPFRPAPLLYINCIPRFFKFRENLNSYICMEMTVPYREKGHPMVVHDPLGRGLNPTVSPLDFQE